MYMYFIKDVAIMQKLFFSESSHTKVDLSGFRKKNNEHEIYSVPSKPPVAKRYPVLSSEMHVISTPLPCASGTV